MPLGLGELLLEPPAIAAGLLLLQADHGLAGRGHHGEPTTGRGRGERRGIRVARQRSGPRETADSRRQLIEGRGDVRADDDLDG